LQVNIYILNGTEFNISFYIYLPQLSAGVTAFILANSLYQTINLNKEINRLKDPGYMH